MKYQELKKVLASNHDLGLQVVLPSGDFVPAHFHITEVGKVTKEFIDCGGTKRETKTCVLQVWVAHDLDHRLTTTKLSKILGLSETLFGEEDLAVELEYEDWDLSVFTLEAADATKDVLVLTLGAKHTACLAPDKCGVNKCGPKGCC